MKKEISLKGIGGFVALTTLAMASTPGAETLSPSAQLAGEDSQLSRLRTAQDDFAAIAIRNASLAPVWEEMTEVITPRVGTIELAPRLRPATASIFGFVGAKAPPHIGRPVTGEVSTALLVSAGLLGLTHLSGSRARSQEPGE